MTQSKNLSVRKHGAGDAVVDGLLRGIVAGLAMAAVLVFVELLQGQSPGITLSRFGLNGPATPIAGLLGHLAVAAVYVIQAGTVGDRPEQVVIQAGMVGDRPER